MSDIHLLESNFSANGSGAIIVVFHVPNDIGQNNYPGNTVSIVSGISQAEQDALTAGTLVEVVKTVRDNIDKGQAVIKTRIQSMWATIAADTQTKLNENYKFYGVELARAV